MNELGTYRDGKCGDPATEVVWTALLELVLPPIPIDWSKVFAIIGAVVAGVCLLSCMIAPFTTWDLLFGDAKDWGDVVFGKAKESIPTTDDKDIKITTTKA